MNAVDLLRNSRVKISPETFFLVSLQDTEWQRLLEDPALSPRMTAPFMIFKDDWEITLLLDRTDYAKIEPAITAAKVQGGFRKLTFDIELDFNVVGFLAAVSKVLAEAGISVIALSAFSRDHILVSQDDLADALKALRHHVAELC